MSITSGGTKGQPRKQDNKSPLQRMPHLKKIVIHNLISVIAIKSRSKGVFSGGLERVFCVPGLLAGQFPEPRLVPNIALNLNGRPINL